MKYTAELSIILLVFVSSYVVVQGRLISLNCKSGGINPNRVDWFQVPGNGTMFTILNYCAKLKGQNKSYEEFDGACLTHCITSCKFPYGDCGEEGVDTLEHCTCYMDPQKDSFGYKAKMNKTKTEDQEKTDDQEDKSSDSESKSESLTPEETD